MRKYNSFCDSMIQNYRDIAKERKIPTEHLTNEQIFNLIEYWSLPTNDETVDAVMDAIKEGLS